MKKMVLLIVTLLLTTTGVIRSQVTIGTLSEPAKGALLDLKQQDDLTGNTNSSKGVMLPRVLLTDMNSLSPMLSGADLTDATLKLSHTGLVVYNVNTTSPFQEGIYSWDGEKWNFCINTAVISANNGLTLSGETVKLGGSLTAPTTITTNGDNSLTISGTPGNGKTVISSDLTITSGNPGTGKVLRSDASGNTSWGNIAPGANPGTAPTYGYTYDISFGTGGSPAYMEYYVSVPPGNSTIQAGFRIHNSSSAAGYVTFRLSNSSTVYNDIFGGVDGLADDPHFTGIPVSASQYVVGQVTFYVTNTTGSDKIVYVWGNVGGDIGVAQANNVQLTTNAGENYILCIY